MLRIHLRPTFCLSKRRLFLRVYMYLLRRPAPVMVNRHRLELAQADHAALRRRLLAITARIAQEFRRFLRVGLLVERQTKEKVAEAEQDASRGCYSPPRVVRRHDPPSPSSRSTAERVGRNKRGNLESGAILHTLLSHWFKEGRPEQQACSGASASKDLSLGAHSTHRRDVWGTVNESTHPREPFMCILSLLL